MYSYVYQNIYLQCNNSVGYNYNPIDPKNVMIVMKIIFVLIKSNNYSEKFHMARCN